MALSASEITQSIKSQNKDPRVESDLELKFETYPITEAPISCFKHRNMSKCFAVSFVSKAK